MSSRIKAVGNLVWEYRLTEKISFGVHFAVKDVSTGVFTIIRIGRLRIFFLRQSKEIVLRRQALRGKS